MSRKGKPRPTQERLREIFHYDPETGIFVRRSSTRMGPKDKEERKYGAGRLGSLGYVLVMVDGVNYIAGGVAHCYVHGVWPDRIKYANGDATDNRIANIRIHEKRAEVKERRLTQGRLKELLRYNPDTGLFSWISPSHSSMLKSGDVAGATHGLGYIQIGVDYRKYLAHQLAWLYMTGEWPTEIDHINRVRSDNRWENLRLATRSENNLNRTLKARVRVTEEAA